MGVISRVIKLPKTLLRTFETEDHAWSFVRGKVRFGLLAGYRRVEDSRRDETEGSVCLAWKLTNPVYCDRSSGNGYYILCTSDSEGRPDERRP
jgi:hypothetical protein